MCGSKPKTPKAPPPPPAAPPPPSATASGFSSAGNMRSNTGMSERRVQRMGTDRLRIGLNVPNWRSGRWGLNIND